MENFLGNNLYLLLMWDLVAQIWEWGHQNGGSGPMERNQGLRQNFTDRMLSDASRSLWFLVYWDPQQRDCLAISYRSSKQESDSKVTTLADALRGKIWPLVRVRVSSP